MRGLLNDDTVQILERDKERIITYSISMVTQDKTIQYMITYLFD